MRRTTNSEQPSPSRRSKRPRKTNENLSGYVVGMSRKGKCGKEYTACKNLMKSFNECEARGNDARLSGDTDNLALFSFSLFYTYLLSK